MPGEHHRDEHAGDLVGGEHRGTVLGAQHHQHVEQVAVLARGPGQCRASVDDRLHQVDQPEPGRVASGEALDRRVRVDLVQAIIDRRAALPRPAREDRDMLDVLMMLRGEDGTAMFTADEITGMFISMMFAGHHTSSGTAAWTLIELLRHPDVMTGVVAELDALYADGSDVSFQALREIPLLESAVKEALRLHPPLILLLRVVKEPIEVGGHTVPAGSMIGATPAISNRIAEDFPSPDSFDPSRYSQPRQEDLLNRWTWIPFGAGRHRCVGSAFAMMQLKAIFSVILRDYEFELAQPSDSYRDDTSKMVIQLAQPCRSATAGGPRDEDHRRPRPVPGTRHVRARSTRRLHPRSRRPTRCRSRSPHPTSRSAPPSPQPCGTAPTPH